MYAQDPLGNHRIWYIRHNCDSVQSQLAAANFYSRGEISCRCVCVCVCVCVRVCVCACAFVCGMLAHVCIMNL